MLVARASCVLALLVLTCVELEVSLSDGAASSPVHAANWKSVVCDGSSVGEWSGCGDSLCGCKVVDGRGVKSAIAEGRFVDGAFQDGWGKLWVRGLVISEGLDEKNISATEREKAAFGAGFLEGALTAHLIRPHYLSWYSTTFPSSAPLLNETRQFILDNHAYATKLAQNGTKRGDRYAERLGQVLAQVIGIRHGINWFVGNSPGQDQNTSLVMSELDMLLLQAAGDLYDVIPATKPSRFKLDPNLLSKGDFHHEFHKATSCSSIIKVKDDLSDVFLGHTTWSTFESMLRVFKHYEVAIVPGYRTDTNSQRNVVSKVSFSAKPGMVYSKDDFYVLPLPEQRLVVMETTNGIMNKELYKKVNSQSLMTWHRIPIANSLAQSGAQWLETFKKQNMGTYANQWIVADLKRFVASKDGAVSGFLHILEVGPGFAVGADVTDVLKMNGNVWPSMNVPFFPQVYNVSGFPDAFAKYGDEYSYENCPRHKIFMRDHHKVQSLDDTERILRYNKFQSDPLSQDNPDFAISARSDLRLVKPKAFGGIDTKVTSLTRVIRSTSGKYNHLGVARAQNGPTHDAQTPFRWSTSPFAQNVHLGQPDLYNFSFVEMDASFHEEMPNWRSHSFEQFQQMTEE